MKTTRFIFACLVVAVIAVWAGSAWAVNYVNLVQGTEKWFESEEVEKGIPWKMHTVVYGYHERSSILHREILRGDTTEKVEDLLFSVDHEGDIYHHGDLLAEVFSEPILWVDAPLSAGKTWTDSRPEVTADGPSGRMIHYVFAVLEQRVVSCPAGLFQCNRVFVVEVAPDGSVKDSTFWYNSECGLIMCDLENQYTFRLKKVYLNDRSGEDDPDRQESRDQSNLTGLITVPNPAKPTAHISFALQAPAQVEVGVYDISGRLVKRLVAQEHRAAGPVSVYWPGTDESGRRAASGTYILRVQADQNVWSDRITLVR